MKILGVHHVAIICSDYEKSKHFYVNILGLKIIHEEYREGRDSFKLDLLLPDQSQIELFSFPNAPIRASYPEAQGLRHLAFRAANIEMTIAELQAKAISVETIRTDQVTNKRFTFFNDPDGLPLELYEI